MLRKSTPNRFISGWSLLLLSLLSSVAVALDITLNDVTCDESLSIYVKNKNMTMECSDGDGGITTACPLGSDITLSGSLLYIGIADVGLVDGYAFVTSDLEFVGVQFELIRYLQVPICGEYVTSIYDDDNQRQLEVDDDEDNGNDDNENGDDEVNGDDDDAYSSSYCPGDGEYEFLVPFVLPNELNKATWLASGWQGQGHISFFSEANNVNSLIGYCQLSFATAVTAADGDSFISKAPIPSAKITALVVLAFAAFLILSCFYRVIRDCVTTKDDKKKKRDMMMETKTIGSTPEEEGSTSTADFTKMEDAA